jgi:UDP-glucose 4-epimerase
MKKNIIIVTGGAGFIGSSLIKYLVKKTKHKIISIDNYSSGSTKNHVKNINVKYIKGDNKNINKFLNSYKIKLKLFFILVNFQEFIKVLKIIKNVLNITLTILLK